jgi:hypothetical protein
VKLDESVNPAKVSLFFGELVRAARTGGDERLVRLECTLADWLNERYVRGYWAGVHQGRKPSP